MKALWLGLALAGAAVAQDGAPAQPRGPLSCEEKCQQIAGYCEDPCARIKKNPEATRTCRSNCKRFLKVCEESCREKGKIDAEFLEEKLAPKGAKKPAP